MDLSDVEKQRWIEHRMKSPGYRTRGIGSMTSQKRKKEVVSLFKEYPSITYVQKKLSIDRKIVKAVLNESGLL